jgi:hypothetical protein
MSVDNGGSWYQQELEHSNEQKSTTITDLQREIVVLNICRKVEEGYRAELADRVRRADNLIKEIAADLSVFPQYAHIHSMADKYLFIREGEEAGD